MPRRRDTFALFFSRLLSRAAGVSLRTKIMGMAAGAVLATGGIGIIQAHRILAVALSGGHPVIDHIVRQMLYSLLAGIILTMLAAAVLTWAITRPLRRLLEGTRALRQELWGQPALPPGTPASDPARPAGVPPAPADEIGRLSEDFNLMIRELAKAQQERREKDRLRQEFLQHVIASQEAERRRLARELHDQTGQSLAALMVGMKIVQNAASIDEMRKNIEVLRENITREMEAIHQMAVRLRPSILDDAGLVPALDLTVADLRRRHDTRAQLTVVGFTGRRLPGHVETAVFRVIQEALLNVVRHAQAASAQVILEWNDDGIRGVVADDGRGFDPLLLQRERLGIYGMEERITLLGGAFSLESEPGEGTMLSFRLPQESISNQQG